MRLAVLRAARPWVLKGLGLGFEHIVMSPVYLTHFRHDYAAMMRPDRGFLVYISNSFSAIIARLRSSRGVRA